MRQMFKQVRQNLSDITCILSIMFGVSLLLFLFINFFLCPLSLVHHYCGNGVNPIICNMRSSMQNIQGLEMNCLLNRKVRVRESLHKNYTAIMSNNSQSCWSYFRTHSCICDTTRRNSFSPNCCFNDQISYHSNQGQLDDS